MFREEEKKSKKESAVMAGSDGVEYIQLLRHVKVYMLQLSENNAIFLVNILNILKWGGSGCSLKKIFNKFLINDIHNNTGLLCACF